MALTRGYKGDEKFLYYLNKNTESRMFIDNNCHGTFSIFLLYGNPDKDVPKHNKFPNSRKSYAIPHFAQRLCRWAFLGFMPPIGGIKPLTRTIFDPSIFLIFSKSSFFHISPTRLNNSLLGNHLDFALKIAHRGNTGSHRGKRKLFCLSGN